ncbi:MAG TPA: YncE family protein [Streptosporangiaceae bacterium]|nr:YncE family protein [Streptosporangiaceae bacterium]
MHARIAHTAVACCAAAIALGAAGCGAAPAPDSGPAGPASSAAVRPAGRPGPPGRALGWVLDTPPCMGDEVSVIDTATGRALPPVRVGRGVDAIAAAPDGRTVYVSSGRPNTNGTVCTSVGPQQPANTVTPISTATGRAGTPIHAGRYPGPIVIAPDSATFYVASLYRYSVVPVSAATGRPARPIRLRQFVTAMAITPDGATIYAAGSNSSGQDLVTPISTATATADRPIRIPGYPSAMAITPDGRTVYVVTGKGVTPISTATDTAGRLIRVGPFPGQIVIAPDGTTAYVTSSRGVTPIDIATDRPERTVKVSTGPVAITPDGRTIFVAGFDAATRTSEVTAIDTATGRAGRPILVRYPRGVDLSGIGIAPDGRTAYLLNEIFEPGFSRGTVIPLRIASGRLGRPIGAGIGPSAIVFSP